ncbi:hypothetical protein B0O99DRAFT_593918 [Bisporella sp. PMI_857]|nr:hypothetical protein B0O99DRAFT_593918 [Bisporella sp. PMI_857]
MLDLKRDKLQKSINETISGAIGGVIDEHLKDIVKGLSKEVSAAKLEGMEIGRQQSAIQNLTNEQVQELCTADPRIITFIKKEVDTALKLKLADMQLPEMVALMKASSSFAAFVEWEAMKIARRQKTGVEKASTKLEELEKKYNSLAAVSQVDAQYDSTGPRSQRATESPLKEEVKKVYVGNLAPGTHHQELIKIFDRAGRVGRAVVHPPQYKNGFSYGFVEFLSTEAVPKAVKMNGEKHGGQVLKVKEYVPMDFTAPKRSFSGSQGCGAAKKSRYR